MIVNVLMSFHEGINLKPWMNKLVAGFKSKTVFIVQERTIQGADNGVFVYRAKEESDLVTKYADDEGFAFYSSYNCVEELEQFYTHCFEAICEPITAVYALYKNRSLEVACQKKGICLKYIEYSALRKDMYYEHDMCWFLEREITSSGEEGRIRYEKFYQYRNQLYLKEPLTAQEILMLGTKRKDIMPIIRCCTNKEMNYKMGIALPTDYKEFSGEWTSDVIRKRAEMILSEDEILYRVHPGVRNKFDGKHKDISGTSYDFIAKCDTIVSAGSNISFEAMLFGRKVIDLANMAYSDRILNTLDVSKDCMYDDWYINFVYFCLYVPLELLCDEEYVRWRCKDKPNEAEIFNRNFEFICRNYLNIDYRDIQDEEGRTEYIWSMRDFSIEMGERQSKLALLERFSIIEWKTREIVVCGCGVDAESIVSIVENFGGEVKEFLLMEEKNIEEFLGKPVYSWGERDYTGNEVFIISQRNTTVQRKVMDRLSKNNIKNILFV